MRNALLVVLLLFAVSACANSGGSGQAAQTPSLVDAGHRVAQIKCARCHAIEASGESRNPNAPPFREVSRAVAIMASQETLAEGIRIGHRDMPPVRLNRSEMEALNAYLRSLQTP